MEEDVCGRLGRGGGVGRHLRELRCGEATNGGVRHSLHPCCSVGIGKVKDWIWFGRNGKAFEVDCWKTESAHVSGSRF